LDDICRLGSGCFPRREGFKNTSGGLSENGVIAFKKDFQRKVGPEFPVKGLKLAIFCKKRVARHQVAYKISLSKDCSGGNNRPSYLWCGGLYLLEGVFLKGFF
jgi:hypothetical protein